MGKLLLPFATYGQRTLEVALLQKRIDEYTHDKLMCISHTFHVFIHIDSLRVKATIAESVHDIVVEPLHISWLVAVGLTR